jgi:hypothetical protein
MKCLHCNTQLIHGGDHDGEEDDEYDIVSNLRCPNCNTDVYVYHSFEKDGRQQELPLSEEPDMWLHHCTVERSDMAIGKGEPCNWCGEEENESCS